MVTVDGTFTSFASDIFDPSVRTSFVNGIQLTSSGVVTGNNGTPPPGIPTNYYQSNTVNFAAPTTSLTFNYNPNLHLLPNSFEFIANAAPTDVNIGDLFQLGTLRVTNGLYYPNTDIGITLTTHSDPQLTRVNNQTFSGTIRYQSISSSILHDSAGNPYIDPVAEADHFYFLPGTGMGIIGDARVYDLYYQPAGNPGNVGVFALYGHIGSLDLDSLVALSGGFTTSTTGEAVVNPVFPGAAPVPEPGTMLLLGSGLAGLVGYGRRRLKK